MPHSFSCSQSGANANHLGELPSAKTREESAHELHGTLLAVGIVNRLSPAKEEGGQRAQPTRGPLTPPKGGVGVYVGLADSFLASSVLGGLDISSAS